MGLLEPFRVAFDALWANKLRAILTMLGVIIGVSSVIIMVAIVQGARQKVIEQFESNGSNLIFAFYAPKSDSINRGGFSGLTMSDVNAISERSSLVSSVSPTASTQVQAQVSRNRKSVQLTGVSGNYSETHGLTVSQGRFYRFR